MRATRRCLSWHFPGTLLERPILLRGRTASADSAHCVEHSGPTRFPSAGDDVALGALHDGKQLFVLRLRHIEFRHRVVEVLAEGGPLALGDLEVLVRTRSWNGRCSFGVHPWPNRPFRS